MDVEGHSVPTPGGNTSPKPGKVKHTRRLIGIRLLFPSIDGRSIVDKCRIWVERHKNKYFVGWTTEQLQEVDTIVRPLDVISPELYKLHMNRNEFNRMKYLQFCLETEEPWAEDFRNKLNTSPENGGFAGLNQAKVVATDLWRHHSADYRSCMSSSGKSSRSSQSSSPDEIASKRIKRESNNTPDWPTSSPKLHMNDSPDLSNSVVKQEKLESCQYGAIDLSYSTIKNETTDENFLNNEPRYRRNSGSTADDIASGETAPSDSIRQLNHFVSNILGPQGDQGETSMVQHHPFAVYTAPVFPFNPSLEAVGYYPPPLPIQLVRNQTSSPDQNSLISAKPSTEGDENQQNATGDSPSNSCGPRGRDWKWAPKSWRGKHGSNTEWKKSERGMSFLFPSISDQPLTLWEKVNIIVMRHKHNYFLDWTPAQVEELDPLVRPKVLVTKERYKEYCHRNAMKYDSNLQFAMEGTDDWAEQFRSRLRLEPEQGGFSNMCHVRSEAGRLWREHSGKYRHRNVVKENMDMNESKTVNSDAETSNSSFPPTKTALPTHPKTKRHAPQKTLPVLPFQNDNYENAVTVPVAKRAQCGGRLNSVINRLSVMKSTTDEQEYSRQNDGPGLEKTQAIDWLWSCREMLHNVCREDPAASWHGRLRPYLHVFRERLGGDYEFPTTVSGCIADLMLVLLDGEIQSTNCI